MGGPGTGSAGEEPVPSRSAPTRRPKAGFAERMRRGDSYGLLLILLLFSYVLLALVEDSPQGHGLVSLTFGAMLILALHTSHVRGRLMRLAVALTVIAVALAFAHAVVGGQGPLRVSAHMIFLLVTIAPIAILVRITRHPVINLETILGAVCAYVIIGMFFAGIYRAATTLGPGPFFQQTQDATPVQYLYFSFVTLTTLGFGDLTPAFDSGRVMVTFEALLGQFFLVTVVAGLVGSFGRERVGLRGGRATSEPGADEPDTDEPDGVD